MRQYVLHAGPMRLTTSEIRTQGEGDRCCQENMACLGHEGSIVGIGPVWACGVCDMTCNEQGV